MIDFYNVKEYISYLNYHTELYDKGTPEISDSEWDKIYFALQDFEKETGIIYPNSPTQSIQYNIVNKLEKIEHNHPMLSLPKTKDIEEAANKFDEEYIVMLKLDGLTCSLTYENGELVRAETRGDGYIGENILHNARVLNSIPKTIPYKDPVTLDGEIICKKSNFKEFENEYKNPRNFAAGSIRLLDAYECTKRKLTFVVWDIINPDLTDKLSEKFEYVNKWGFETVPILPHPEDIESYRDYPIDGLVFKVNSSLERSKYPATAHHLGGAIAFKFEDEIVETNLIRIDYEPSRTGVLTPVAVFETVELEGSEVCRASLHNLSIMNELSGGIQMIGDKLYIYKANQIIPQVLRWEHLEDVFVADNIISLPAVCPVCGGDTRVVESSQCQMLMCANPECSGKLINQLDHFVGKKGLDIKGLSKATFEKLIDYGWIERKKDIFNLTQRRADWVKKPGFGPKSVDNVLAAIEAGKHTTLAKFICSLGIPEIGTTASKDICKEVESYDDFRERVRKGWNFSSICGIGPIMEENILKFDYSEADEIAALLVLENAQSSTGDPQASSAANLKFVVTGSLHSFKNRDELKSTIESLGGKVVGSVSKNTDYLICNDKNSGTSKITNAQKLGVTVITEDEFIAKFLGD